MDREKLAKVLAMTTSPVSHEALAAVRMANKMLTDAKMTWGELLAAGGTTVNIALKRASPDGFHDSEAWFAPHLKDKVTITLMFRALFSQPRTGNEEFWRTMDSIHHHFETHGVLTQGQYQALRNCYRRTLKTA